MSGKESRQCPHYSTHEGVCGCPEFWQPARRTQTDQISSTLQETASRLHDQYAPNRLNPSVNSIPLPDCTKIQSITPAPPGPPKETCFFWYHGTCRRGNECERPHEAHPTWPIPPPPGFRHFQPCTLPLCPLRADLVAAQKPQEYRPRRPTMGGQLDGAAFSRTTTAGESSSDVDSINDIHTDRIEVDDGSSQISDHFVLGVCARASLDSQTSREAGPILEGEVRAHLDLGKTELESDYVSLSQLLCPPPMPPTNEETLLSISHSSTLNKRRQAPAQSPDNINKRVKLEHDEVTNTSDSGYTLEHPAAMSQSSIKQPEPNLDDQSPRCSPPTIDPMHTSSPGTFAMKMPNNNSTSPAPRAFHPPRAPRNMSTSLPICFFYYHKGYCQPKLGRRCDYLHDTNASHQTVSLPHGIGIDNHDPTCSLPLCPIRLRNVNGVASDNTIITDDTKNHIQGARRIKAGRRYKQAKRLRRQLGEEDMSRQGLTDISNIPSMQHRPHLLSPLLPATEASQAFTTPPPIKDLKRKRRKRGNKKALHSQWVGEPWPETSVKDKSIQGFTPEIMQESSPEWALLEFPSSPHASHTYGVYESHQVSINRAANTQSLPHKPVASHEYSQETLGWSTEERRAEILKSQVASEAWRSSHQDRPGLQPIASDKAALLAAGTAISLSRVHVGDGGERLERESRCQRRRSMYEDFDGHRRCPDCKGAVVRIDNCSDGSHETGKAAAASGDAAGYQLPEGQNRLDWDTDLVRRLFGEIE